MRRSRSPRSTPGSARIRRDPGLPRHCGDSRAMRQPRTCGTTSRNTVAPNAAKCPEAAAWHHRTKGLLGDDFRRSVAVRTRTVGMLAKVPRHRPGGDRAVRDAILLLRGKLTDGPAADRLGCRFEQRVVAEPVLTAQIQRDPPVE